MYHNTTIQTRRRTREAVFLTTLFVGSACGQTVDGLTEPFRTIRVATPETGIIKAVAVEEGDEVAAEQVLAELDTDIHILLLEIAKQSMEANGRRDAAFAEKQLRKARLEQFTKLREKGHARQEEVNRARMELAVAEAQLTSAEEDLLIKELEHKKFKSQLDRRSIRAPVSGLVSEIHKQKGEFVAPNSPEVLTIVELDPLVAVFSLTSRQAMRLKVGQKMKVRFSQIDKESMGKISFIAPVTDAESGTVRMKIRIKNPNREFRSGERCMILVPNN